MGEMDDLEGRIAESLDRGDLAEAATRALEGYGPQLLGYLMALAKDDDTAEDVFAQLGEDVWRGLPRFQRRCSARTWMYKLARNAFLRHHASAHERRRGDLDTSAAGRLVAQVRSATA